MTTLIQQDRSVSITPALSKRHFYHCDRRTECFGLAALLQNVEQTYYHGQHGLMDNANITWLLLRDMPGASRMQRQRHRMERVRTTRAILRHGMPIIDFAIPDDRELYFDVLKHRVPERQWAVMRKLDTALAQQHRHHRDEVSSEAGTDTLPVPYLAFPARARNELYSLATTAQSFHACSRCARFDPYPSIVSFRHNHSQISCVADGTSVPDCPLCHQRQKCFVQSIVPCGYKRRFTRAFQKLFCAAIARGLPVKAVGPCIYRGMEGPLFLRHSPSHSQRTLALMSHVLQSQIDGSRYRVDLPNAARVLAHPNQILEAGEVWAHAITEIPYRWLRPRSSQRWSNLCEVCGDFRTLGLLQRLWFEQNLSWLAERPNEILLRADLLGRPCRELPPLKVYWDLEPVSQILDGMLEAAILPAVMQRALSSLRVPMIDRRPR